MGTHIRTHVLTYSHAHTRTAGHLEFGERAAAQELMTKCKIEALYEKILIEQLDYQMLQVPDQTQRKRAEFMVNEDVLIELIFKIILLLIQDYNLEMVSAVSSFCSHVCFVFWVGGRNELQRDSASAPPGGRLQRFSKRTVIQAQFERIQTYLKQRLNVIKKPKKKLLIESFLNKLVTQKEADQLNKIAAEKRKNQLKNQKKQVDTLKQKNNILTKYLVSNLDWNSTQ